MSRKTTLIACSTGVLASCVIYYLGILVILWRRDPGFWWPGPDFGMPLALLSAAISIIGGLLAIPRSERRPWHQSRKTMVHGLIAALMTDTVWIAGYGLTKAVGSA